MNTHDPNEGLKSNQPMGDETEELNNHEVVEPQPLNVIFPERVQQEWERQQANLKELVEKAT